MINPPRLSALENRPGWTTRWQLTLIEPPEEPSPGFEPKPRTNIVISVTSDQSADAMAAANSFLESTSVSIPDFQHADPTEITFADAAPGVRADVNFPAAPSVRLRQIHLFRVDAGVLSQLVITGEMEDSDADIAELETLALTYQP